MPVAAPIAGAVASAVISKAMAPDSGGGGQTQAAPQLTPEQQEMERKLSAQALASGEAASAALARQGEINEAMYKHWTTNFKPVEEALAKDSKNFGSIAEQEEAAGVAHADTVQAFDRARDATRKTVASYGVNPASGRWADSEISTNLAEAKTDVASQNLARKGVRDTAFTKKMNVAALGKGTPAQVAAGMGSVAATNASLGNLQFNQGQAILRNGVSLDNETYARRQAEEAQTRAGLAPFVSLAQQGIKKWFDPATPPIKPTYEYEVG